MHGQEINIPIYMWPFIKTIPCFTETLSSAPTLHLYMWLKSIYSIILLVNRARVTEKVQPVLDDHLFIKYKSCQIKMEDLLCKFCLCNKTAHQQQ